MINTINVFTLILLKLDCKHIKLFLNVYKNGTLVIISDNYHNLGQLLLLMIIVDIKNWAISIIVKENITVNTLISHPYYVDAYTG